MGHIGHAQVIATIESTEDIGRGYSWGEEGGQGRSCELAQSKITNSHVSQMLSGCRL
jgi:hypothetical protein